MYTILVNENPFNKIYRALFSFVLLPKTIDIMKYIMSYKKYLYLIRLKIINNFTLFQYSL